MVPDGPHFPWLSALCVCGLASWWWPSGPAGTPVFHETEDLCVSELRQLVDLQGRLWWWRFYAAVLAGVLSTLTLALAWCCAGAGCCCCGTVTLTLT